MIALDANGADRGAATVAEGGRASGVPVRWADVAAPWLATAGGDTRGTVYSAAIVARVALRYDDTKADLVQDDEYEAVLHPLSAQIDPTTAISIDYDDRDLLSVPSPQLPYRLCDAAISTLTGGSPT